MGFTAKYFTNWDEKDLKELTILPPYEPKDRQIQWVRGSIRNKWEDGIFREFTVTGPKMKTCYSGCNWNRISFAMNGSFDPEVYNFERWTRSVCEHVKESIFSDPSKFKPGAMSNSRFVFDDDYIKPSNNPAIYPDEMKVRLSTKKVPDSTGEGFDDVSDADLFLYCEDGNHIPINPVDIRAGSSIVPILKFSYYRNIERFGLVITLIRGMVFLGNEKSAARVENQDWDLDYISMDAMTV